MADKVRGSDRPWLKNYKLGPYSLKKSLEPYPKTPVYHFLDHSADAYPRQIAIEFLGKRIRYEELRDYVNRLSNALVALGIGKGDKVAAILPNCPQYIISDFAVSKAGATFVPCSTLHKVHDLEHEIGASGAKMVICSDDAWELVQAIKAKTALESVVSTSPMDFAAEEPQAKQVPDTYRLKDLIAENKPDPPQVNIDPTEDLAYLSFTGGATGIPKGVMITHYNRACNVRQTIWALEPLWPGIKGKAAAEILVPLFHSYGHLGMQASIALGLRILLVSDPRDIDQAVALLKEHRPLLAYVVPTHLMRIAERKLGRLPIMFMSGAAPLPQQIFEAIKGDIMMPVTEGYGLTECGPLTHANLSTFSKITGIVTKERQGIGLPVPDTEAKIEDTETGEELGAGESGELLVRGPQTMKGYWPNPGNGLDGNGWLRTGDIARMDENGYFVLEDRIKDMANISGYKVYTTQVDEVLFQCPGVAMAAAVGIPDPERPGSERDIIAYCRERLPSFAVPKYVEFREELPLTVTQKIFKRALKEEEDRRTRG